MKFGELTELGIPRGKTIETAFQAIRVAAASGLTKEEIRVRIAAVVADPSLHLGDEVFGELAKALEDFANSLSVATHRDEPVPYKVWGSILDEGSLQQMDNACRLPVSVAGALMPDAHLGYGLPIGGVLAAKNAVIPYAVGMDIACRMKMTVLDMPVSVVKREEELLRDSLETETRFGLGAGFEKVKEHPVMDEDWSVSPITKKGKEKARKQLGSSGSGNHFVEYGTLTIEDDELGLKPGTYLALLSHSGSRGTGGAVAQHYSKLAMSLPSELPKELIHLAWLDLDSELGQEYWEAMELMGRYAAASHELIHRDIARFLKADVLLDIENHHNFAWKENHFGEDVIVHRKGATPADLGKAGIIPGSMATPGYVVQGRGNPESLNSAAHGAGRRMSRRAARDSFTWEEAREFLSQRGVVLISAGLDEVPMSYKDIESVMDAQSDLVQIRARFDPKLVKMAPEGERPED